MDQTITGIILSNPEPAWSRMHRERNRMLADGMAYREIILNSLRKANPVEIGSFKIPIVVDPAIPPGTIEVQHAGGISRIENISNG